MNKILVVNVNWLGDVIFSSPVFKALKQAYPKATVVCLAVPRVREVLEANPYVDRIMIYDEKGKDWSILAKFKLILQLRRENFDAAFLLHRSWTRALLVFLAGIPRRIGYDAKNRGKFLTDRIQPLTGVLHRSDRYLKVIESFGIKVEDRLCEWTVPQDAQERIRQRLAKEGITEGDQFVVINCGGNWDLKRWPKTYFARLIQQLIRQEKTKVVISGGPNDVDLVQEIAAASGEKPIILAGQTQLKDLGALLQRASLVISSDTGPLHIANAVGTTTIGLFGPTRPEETGPRGRGKFSILQNDVGCNRVACYYLECPDNVCMQSITVEDVLHEVQRLRN